MINKENLEDLYPLFPLQEGMLYSHLAEPGAHTYVEQICYTVTSELDLANFEAAWNVLFERHAALRTAIVYGKSKEPLQMVLEQRQIEFLHRDLRGVDDADARVRELTLADRARGFDLAGDVLMRITVFQLGDTHYEIVWTHHHMIMDGWSLSVLQDELLHCYYARVNGTPISLPPAPSLRSYARYLAERDREQTRALWRDHLAGYSEPAHLPFIAPRGEERYDLQKCSVGISPQLFARIEALASHFQVTTNTLVQALWAVVVGRYTCSDDVVFGTVVSGRPEELVEAQRAVGLFSNTVPTRVRLDETRSLRELCLKLQSDATRTRAGQYVPLSEICECSEVGADLIDHIVVFENYPGSDDQGGEREDADLAIERSAHFEQTPYPFVLVVEPGDYPAVDLHFDARRCQKSAIRTIADCYRHLVHHATSDPECAIDELRLFDREEEARLLGQLDAGAEQSYPRDASVSQLFAETVASAPDATALRFGEESFTYLQVAEAAQPLARTIAAHVGSDQIVAVCLDHSADAVISFLAILDSGNAYLPLDTTMPRERMVTILEDARVALVVTTPTLARELAAGPWYFLDCKSGHITDGQGDVVRRAGGANAPADARAAQRAATDPAYVIYTSGTTGRPKGVVVCHRNIVRLVRDTNYVAIRPEHVVASASSLSFDAATFEIWGALLNGACLSAIDRETLTFPDALGRALRSQKITHMFVTTAVLNQVAAQAPDAFGTLDCLLFGGERVDPEAVRTIVTGESPARTLHVYGPTENTTFSTWYEVSKVAQDADNISIGRSIARSTCYVLDHRLRPTPAGAPGEVYLGGDGLALGYLHDAGLTDERFLADPRDARQRLYRTGDRGRINGDGQLEFLERRDSQVKLRGFRIELGEIESCLRQSDAVGACAVVVVGESLSKHLVAWVVCRDSAGGDTSGHIEAQLHEFLAARLPGYMIPTRIETIAALPLNRNGKVDRRQLIALARDRQARAGAASSGQAPPLTPLQAQVAAIWRDVLEVEHIGLDGDFFRLGGHSLRATRIIGRLRQALRQDVALRLIFDHSRFEDFCRALDASYGEGGDAITTITRRKREQRPVKLDD